MPIARIGKIILFFVHIPKTGGASIEHYLEQSGSIALKYKSKMQWSVTTAQHMHASVYEKLIPRDFYDHSFAVIRDPLDRLKSEYKYRYDRMETRAEFSRWADLTVDMAMEDPYHLDNHIRPQVDFLTPGMQLFSYSYGLDSVFDWIDNAVKTKRIDRNIWKNKSKHIEIETSNFIRKKIENYYDRDYDIMGRLEARGGKVIVA